MDRGTLTLLSFTPLVRPLGGRAAPPSAGRSTTARQERAATDADVALVRRVAAGEEQALAALYDRHAARVLGLLVRMLGTAGEAEELLQEVFLQAWREAGRYRPERASPGGWLLLIGRSRAVDRLRSARARRRREEEAVRLADAVCEAPVGLRRLERDEHRRRLGAALRALPAAQRQAIEMAFFEDLTHTQISARLRLPLGTVKSRLLLGMKKLRRLLEDPGDRPAPPHRERARLLPGRRRRTAGGAGAAGVPWVEGRRRAPQR